MGAEFLTERLDGNRNKENVKKYIIDLIKEFRDTNSSDEYYDGYSGNWGEVEIGCMFEDKIFDSEEECYEYISNNAVKWEKPLAVRYKDKDGRIFWLIGAWASC